MLLTTRKEKEQGSSRLRGSPQTPARRCASSPQRQTAIEGGEFTRRERTLVPFLSHRSVKLLFMICLALVLFTASCAKPLISGRVVKNVHYWNDDYAATPNDVYYAVRWALRDHGYSIAEERLPEGIITSTWVPVKSDSHCIEMFGRCDYGVTNSYYQLEVQVTSDSGRATVKVGARSKGIVDMQVSSGREEKKILASIGDFLRKFDPDISNLGINE